MALPSSAPIIPCSLSKPLMGEGTEGFIKTATLTVDRTLVWAATGETIYGDPVDIIPNLDGGLSFNVVAVDADGMLDAAGSVVVNWSYTLTVVLALPVGNETKTVNYHFQPTIHDGTKDLDLVPQVGVVSDPPATTTGDNIIINITNEGGGGGGGAGTVTSVNGLQPDDNGDVEVSLNSLGGVSLDDLQGQIDEYLSNGVFDGGSP